MYGQMRRSVYKLSGHLLIFNAPCLSHVVHNESKSVSASFGPSERPLLKKKKVKRDDDGIVNALFDRVPSVLDALNYRVENTEGLHDYLARTEGKTVLRLPATGS